MAFADAVLSLKLLDGWGTCAEIAAVFSPPPETGRASEMPCSQAGKYFP